jgi:hypothetical protein
VGQRGGLGAFVNEVESIYLLTHGDERIDPYYGIGAGARDRALERRRRGEYGLICMHSMALMAVRVFALSSLDLIHAVLAPDAERMGCLQCHTSQPVRAGGCLIGSCLLTSAR